jgi:hypothetical protein
MGCAKHVINHRRVAPEYELLRPPIIRQRRVQLKEKHLPDEEERHSVVGRDVLPKHMPFDARAVASRYVKTNTPTDLPPWATRSAEPESYRNLHRSLGKK